VRVCRTEGRGRREKERRSVVWFSTTSSTRREEKEGWTNGEMIGHGEVHFLDAGHEESFSLLERGVSGSVAGEFEVGVCEDF